VRKPLAYLVGFIVLLLVAWGTYKVMIAKHAVADAQLQKDYDNQKDSTKAWKNAYKAAEEARKNLHDTVSILDSLAGASRDEANKWHDSASAAKRRLILIQRPVPTDTTNPSWMHRSIQLETIVASQERELAGKDAEISLATTRRNLLLSQMSKDSVALHSANDNIGRLDKLVEGFKEKSECKMAWFLPCLSRTQSFVAGGIVGSGVVVLVNTILRK
jgi:hypothetical protein